jgi:hypothetical protein
LRRCNPAQARRRARGQDLAKNARALDPVRGMAALLRLRRAGIEVGRGRDGDSGVGKTDAARGRLVASARTQTETFASAPPILVTA